jgi:hypothetical protein
MGCETVLVAERAANRLHSTELATTQLIPDDKTKYAFDGWFHPDFDKIHGRPPGGTFSVCGPWWHQCLRNAYYAAIEKAESISDGFRPSHEDNAFSDFFEQQKTLRPNCSFPRDSMREAFRTGLSYAKWRIRTALQSD